MEASRQQPSEPGNLYTIGNSLKVSLMKVCFLGNDFRIDNSPRSTVKYINSLHFRIAMMVLRTSNGSAGIWLLFLAIFIRNILWILDDPRNQLPLD
jgi:hypothetical protein